MSFALRVRGPNPGVRARIRLLAILLAASIAMPAAHGATAASAATAASGPATASATTSDVEARVEALLRRMTLAEKIGQLNLVSAGTEFDPRQVSEGRIGGLSNFSDPREIAALQDMARRSRLGIPLLVGLDVLHGYRTMFPVPLGEAASFSPDLARRVAEASAREAAAVGINWTFAPMVDLSRDPRWGRIVEGAGEDPLLGRLFAAARVAGFRAGGVAPTPKHFAGYGAAQGGRDYDATEIPRVDLYDFYLPPFRASIRAGAEILMSAFNALNGVPATANPWLLTELLRHEWGFDGFVVSDWAAIWELIPHGIARDEAEAGRKALLAGVDMDMASDIYAGRLPDEIRAGRVPEAALDEAVRRVLRVKLRLGLFERPDPDPAGAEQAQLTPETRQLAREAARESIVLLQNRELPRPGAPQSGVAQPDVLQRSTQERSVLQRSVLPIAPGTRRIAVVGGLAASPSDQLGPHAARADPKDVITYLDGIRRRAEAAGMSVTYAPGCDPLCERADGFMEAVEAARAADVVIAVLGEPQDISAEGGSRAYLTLPGRQRELLDALTATGTPVVLVLETGRPLELGAAVEKVPAIVMAWYLGTEGGPALADILFGDESPSAKLPVSWPRTVGQVPVHYNRLPTGRPADPKSRWTARYRDEDVRPLFPFGWGLGYTRFAYTGLDVATPTVGAQDVVELRVTVTNTGERAGKEVAQLYVRQPVASRSRPLRELKAFEKIALQPGESRAVTFRVPVRDLGFHLDDGGYVVEPGPFQAWIGGSSLADLEGGFEVTDGLRLPPGAAP